MLKQYIFIALHFSHSLHSLHSLYSFHRELPIAIGIMRTRKMIKMLSIQSKLHCTQERPEYNQSTLKFVSRNVLFGDTIQSILAIENRPQCNFQLRDGKILQNDLSDDQRSIETLFFRVCCSAYTPFSTHTISFRKCKRTSCIMALLQVF